MADGSEIDDVPPDVGLTDLFRESSRGAELGLRVAAPGRVISYDPATQTAQVELGLLMVKRHQLQHQPPVELPVEPTVLPKVPVAWPRTALGYLAFPLTPGDTGLVVFADRSLGEWLRLGITSDPKSARAHSLSDGVFYPGLHPNTNPITPPTPLDATVLHGSAGIRLGAEAVSFVLLAPLLTALQTFAASLGVAANIAAVVAAGNALTTALALPGNVATKVKAI